MRSSTVLDLNKEFHSWREYWCLLHPRECFHIDPDDIPVLVDDRPIPPGDPPPYALKDFMTGSTINSLLGAVGYVGPDQEGGPDPNGPLGPYIRDALIGLGLVRFASSLSDLDRARELQEFGARLVSENAERMAQGFG